MLNSYVNERPEWNLVDIYEDDGISGTTLDDHPNGNNVHEQSSIRYIIKHSMKIAAMVSKLLLHGMFY